MPDTPDNLPDPDATIPVSKPPASIPRNDAPDLPLPEELTALLPGGNYHVESFLGQGGMGAVYKGMQVRLKRPVAIKIMRRDQGRDYGFEQRFEREAQAMAKLNHPNIVSVIDYGEAGPDYLYIVMELVNGADLMDVIRGGQMTQEMALALLPQICDALQFAHDHGIVHRDIKPSNIMLTRDGRVKMADFGLAKPMDGLESGFRTQTGTGMGTPDYAAPEQFDAHAHIDHRADIYALGVMIYQMITGQLPRGVWKPPSQRAEIAPEWDEVVSRAMQSDPGDRYQQASEVKTDVSRITPKSNEGSVKDGSADTPVRTHPSGGAAAKNKEAEKLRSREANLRAPLDARKSRAPLIFGLFVGAVVIAIGAFFALRPVGDDVRSLAPGTPKTEPMNPEKPGLVTSSPTKSEPLPESDWKPLFTDAEWRAPVEPGREFRDGWLHLTGRMLKPRQLTRESLIRTKVRIGPGLASPAIVLRDGAAEWRLELVADTQGKPVELRLVEGTTGSAAPPTTVVSDKREAVFKSMTGSVVIELSISGNGLTASARGQATQAVLRTVGAQFSKVSEWGITATDAWFESVEVQPLPAANEQWRDGLLNEAKLTLSSNVQQTSEGLRFTGIGSAMLSTTSISGRDVAVRMRASFGTASPKLTARQNRQGDKYMLYATGASLIRLESWNETAKRGTLIRELALKSPLQPGQDYELELRIVGQNLTAKLNSEVLGTATDGTLSDGLFGVIVGEGKSFPVLVKSLKFLDLTASAKVSQSPSLPVFRCRWHQALGHAGEAAETEGRELGEWLAASRQRGA